MPVSPNPNSSGAFAAKRTPDVWIGGVFSGLQAAVDASTLDGFVMELNPAGSNLLRGFTGLAGEYIAVNDDGIHLVGENFPRVRNHLRRATPPTGQMSLARLQVNGVPVREMVVNRCVAPVWVN